MTTNPDAFAPLQQAARLELGRQIDAGQGDAAKLVAECGWSWNLAFTLARAINGDGSNALALMHEGIPDQAARAIADAIAARGARGGTTLNPSDKAAAVRGCKAWRGVKGNYLRKVAP